MISEFWQGVFVALSVSLIANLITPLTKNTTLAVFAKISDKIKVFGKWSKKAAITSTNNEIERLDKYYKEPLSFNIEAVITIGLNLMFIIGLTITVFVVLFWDLTPSDSIKYAIVGALGATTTTFLRLFVFISIAQNLRNYNEHRENLVKRLEKLKI